MTVRFRGRSLHVENVIRDLTRLEQHDSIGELTGVGITGPGECNNPGLRTSKRSARDVAAVALGIDMIGDYLTEINVTAPTGIRAVENVGGPDITKLVWDRIEAKRKGSALLS